MVHMAVIYFFYGLAFFLLGYSIFIYPLTRSRFRLADEILLIGAFGVIHGINEWAEMFLMLEQYSRIEALRILSLLLLPISYAFLLLFGVRSFFVFRKNHRPFWVMGVLLPLTMWSIITLRSSDWFLSADIFARYIIGIPGILLAVWALHTYKKELKATGSEAYTDLTMAMLAFAVYGVLAGVIVPKADLFPASVINYESFIAVFGFPVQVFRAAAAVIITYSVIRILRVFELETETYIQERENRFQNIYAKSPIGIETYDSDGALIEANRACVDIFGVLDPSELIGFKLFEDPNVSDEIKERLLKGESVRYAAPFDFELVKEKGLYKTSKSGTIYLDVLITLLGAGQGYLVQLQDITSRKKAEAELLSYKNDLEKLVEERTVKLKKANSLKDLFTDIISHDLLNYAGIIKGACENFQMDHPDNEEIRIFRRNSKKLIDLIEGARQLSTLEEKESLKKEDMDLQSIVEQAVELNRSDMETAGLAVENKIKTSHPIRANPLIEEVFSNLLSNAAKYAAEGKKVIIGSSDSGKTYKVSVMDFGPGILDKDKRDVFTRFTRKTKSGVMGSGLGLTIARKIVELHRGRIWVEDNPDGGSIFYVEIPKK